MPDTDTQKPSFELLDDGTVVNNKKGKAIPVAKYDEESGTVTFDSEKISIEFRQQIIGAIQDDADGTHSSGNIVKGFAIKGRSEDNISPKEPPCPIAKLLGDKDPKVVDWYFKWRPQEAYVRYKVRLDKNGEPITAAVRRKHTQWKQSEDESWGEVTTVTEKEDGMIAERATHRTFLPEEIVGAPSSGEASE